MDNPIIALLTDFGEVAFFVPSIKGVIASINPHGQEAVRLIAGENIVMYGDHYSAVPLKGETRGQHQDHTF